MEKLHFSVTINAPKEKVWDVMLTRDSYLEWSKPFYPGSSFEGNWEKGSKMLFLAPDEKGTMSGMVSYIRENRPHEYISIEHVGEVREGVEDTTSERVQAWKGAHENYTFTEKDGGTQVDIDVDVTDEFKDYMKEAWPKALEKLKELGEK